MKRKIAVLLTVCLMLSGCSAFQEGSYHSVKPHQDQSNQEQTDDVAVSSYTGLYRALQNMIYDGKKDGIITIANYNQLVVARDMRTAVTEVTTQDPIGAYAVEEIEFELGTNGGQLAIAVEISYLHDYGEIKKIRHVHTMEEAEKAIADALNNCDPGIVLQIDLYEERDLEQWVDDYTDRNPEKVMERPQVANTLYPESGSQRVLEIKFTYQNSRDTLRNMQTQVNGVFQEALRLARQEEETQNRYYVLYDYIMKRFQPYQLETSINPAYMLLINGVGDSRAFASVYAAMCHRLGMECIVVTGTRNGQPWNWNIVKNGNMYFHLDLLACSEQKDFILNGDGTMGGYVWDPLEYPPCGVEILPEE